MIEEAKEIVVNYVNSSSGQELISMNDVKTVWFCKTLQNWKVLLITPVPGLYYEVTHNGDKEETYLDVYEKKENRKYCYQKTEGKDIKETKCKR